MKLVYHGETYDVELIEDAYGSNGTLAIRIWDPNEGLFADLTTNIDESDENVGTRKAFVKNDEWRLKFIKENELGKETGRIRISGFNSYMEVEFNERVW